MQNKLYYFRQLCKFMKSNEKNEITKEQYDEWLPLMLVGCIFNVLVFLGLIDPELNSKDE